MWLYIIIVALLSICLHISSSSKNYNETIASRPCRLGEDGVSHIPKHDKNHQIVFFAFLLLFWFLTAFRGESIGNDTKNYLTFYRELGEDGIGAVSNLEIGYRIFCWLLYQINSDPYFLLFVCATICYAFCGIYVYRNSNNILFSTVLLFCFSFSQFCNILRQALAMVIVLPAYELLKKDKKLIPLLLILLASTFHLSALITLIWFIPKYIPKKPVVVIVGCIVLAVLSMTGLLNEVLKVVANTYAGYFNTVYLGTGWLAVSYDIGRALVFYLFVFAAYQRVQEKDTLATANAVAHLVVNVLALSVNLFGRIASYFTIVMIADLPNAFISGGFKHRRFWMDATGLVLLLFFLVASIFRPEWNHLYPYYFNWSN